MADISVAQSLAIEIQVPQILRKHNVLADPLSWRGPVQMEWALDRSMFQAVVAHTGLSPVIDLLVTPLNSQLPVFLSPFPDPAGFSIDYLSVWWDFQGGLCLLSPMVLVCNVMMNSWTWT